MQILNTLPGRAIETKKSGDTLDWVPPDLLYLAFCGLFLQPFLSLADDYALGLLGIDR